LTGDVAEAVEDVLEGHQAETWAAPLLDALASALEAAIRESAEGSAGLKGAQKAQLERDRAMAALRPTFVSFRRTVRIAFGRSSREYRELLDRRSKTSNDPGDPQPSS
jgi:hypothetical protein